MKRERQEHMWHFPHIFCLNMEVEKQNQLLEYKVIYKLRRDNYDNEVFTLCPISAEAIFKTNYQNTSFKQIIHLIWDLGKNYQKHVKFKFQNTWWHLEVVVETMTTRTGVKNKNEKDLVLT